MFESWQSMLKDLRDQNRYKTTKLDGNYVIVGKRGQIALYQDGDLDVWITNTRKAIKAQLIWKARSTYNDGACFVRPQTDLNQACYLIQARKKRQVTEAMRQRGRELAATMRSSEKKTAQNITLDTQSPQKAIELLEVAKGGAK